MHTPPLFNESLLEALTDVVKGCGGPKAMGSVMRPELSAELAGKWVSNCLNHDHPQKFDPEQVLFVLREGRKNNIHCAMNYLLRECGYADAQPIEPDDEKARLQREFVAGVAVLTQLAARLEKAA